MPEFLTKIPGLGESFSWNSQVFVNPRARLGKRQFCLFAAGGLEVFDWQSRREGAVAQRDLTHIALEADFQSMHTRLVLDEVRKSGVGVFRRAHWASGQSSSSQQSGAGQSSHLAIIGEGDNPAGRIFRRNQTIQKSRLLRCDQRLQDVLPSLWLG